VEIDSSPLFILGHPRSGTTHLQNLLAVDPRYATPNLHQVFFPHTFLSAEKPFRKIFGSRLPRTRGFDNTAISFDTPQEDEIALCSMGAGSIFLILMFPKEKDHFWQYLSLKDLTEMELTEWKDSYIRFLKKLAFQYGKPLILRSPPHTARIQTLLDLFPDARFVHIYRNPYTVFQSYRHMLKYLDRNFLYLQRPNMAELDDLIIKHYIEMYDAFFSDLPLLRDEQYFPVKFEDLESDPIEQLEALYGHLNLPGFPACKTEFTRYLESISGYRKNVHQDLTAEEREKIYSAWRRNFEAWGYPA
jgi:hypothetical protein